MKSKVEANYSFQLASTRRIKGDLFSPTYGFYSNPPENVSDVGKM
jgi:hypothetical protein